MRIPVYWINLHESAERRECLLRQFHEKGILHRRVEAIRHEKPHIGCCLSHILAIFQAWSDGNEYALICEDDVDFSLGVEVFTRIQQILKTMPTSAQADWDILQLQYIEPTFLKTLQQFFDTHGVQENRILKGYFMGATATLMNRKGMEKILMKMGYRDNMDPSIYNITATFDHPEATPEEVVYRYIESYCSLYPVLNYVKYSSTLNNSDSYEEIQSQNCVLTSNIIEKLTSENYNVKQGIEYHTLEYDLHWFNGDEEKAKKCIEDIFS
jgi:hypothetical protein